ncbi:MAG: carbohydrate-binding family 9-like protein [Candidatus Hydrogenedentota bacterium]
MDYFIRKVGALPGAGAAWDSGGWSVGETIGIEKFVTPGHGHQPKTEARMLHDGESIAVMFRVEDRYVLAKGKAYQARTHRDSCVEFFVEPVAGKGYFNFEFNCIGTLLLTYIEDSTRKGDGFEKYREVPESLAAGIEVHASLAGPIEEEITEPTTWTVSYRFSKELFEAYVGPLASFDGLEMRGNVYKCADECSHPHWGYWADIGDVLDFHQPDIFVPFVCES